STISYYIEEALEDIGNKSLPFTKELRELMVTTLMFIDDYLEVALADEFNEPDKITKIVLGFRRARNLPPKEDEQAVAEVLEQFGLRTQDEGRGSNWSLGPVGSIEEDVLPEMAPLAVDPEMLEAFWVEALDYIQEVNLLLADIQKTGFDKERVMEIRRKIHTLKGGAGAVGIESVARITHRMEDLLDQLYSESLEFSSDVLDLLCTTGDLLEDIASNTSEQPDYSDLIALYDHVSAGISPQTGKEKIFGTNGVAEVGQFVEDLTALDEDLGDEDIIPELLEIFLLEAEDHLRTVNLRLTELAREGFDKNLIQDVRRSVHTLKGSAGSVGLKMVTALSHRMEDLLDLLYEGELKWNNDISDLLSSSGDVLEDLVAGEVPPETLSTLQLRYNGLLGQTTAADLVSKSVAALGEEKIIDLTDPLYAPRKGDLSSEDMAKEPAAQRQPGEFVRVPLERLDELVRLVSELVITRTTFEQRLGNLTGEVQELQVAIDRLRRISVNLETQYEVTTLGGTKLTFSRPDSETKREFDDLEMDRYTEFHLLTRELTETSGDIKTVGNDLGTLIGDFDSTLTRQSRISSELQEKLMRVRMVPLSTLATRLHRIVRVVARKQNKLATLDIHGEGVELDKMVMEEIADPLMHIIRNGVDHGLEPPELRRVLGKPETGTILLRGYNEGNQVVISIK
ncbi:MAG: Hpt domain-containing protein, partial [Desulfobulbaceae bacterium]|nr:Hpt domain-containing protein [Desulfobulbaceae bacterium]